MKLKHGWNIGTQYSPRRDAEKRGVPSGAVLIEKKNIPNAPKNESGHMQLIMMGESIRQKKKKKKKKKKKMLN